MGHPCKDQGGAANQKNSGCYKAEAAKGNGLKICKGYDFQCFSTLAVSVVAVCNNAKLGGAAGWLLLRFVLPLEVVGPFGALDRPIGQDREPAALGVGPAQGGIEPALLAAHRLRAVGPFSRRWAGLHQFPRFAPCDGLACLPPTLPLPRWLPPP